MNFKRIPLLTKYFTIQKNKKIIIDRQWSGVKKSCENCRYLEVTGPFFKRYECSILEPDFKEFGGDEPVKYKCKNYKPVKEFKIYLKGEKKNGKRKL